LKVVGEDEWNARKYGGSKRSVWRKIHIGIYEKTLEVRAAEFTTSGVGYAPMLLDQIPPRKNAKSWRPDTARASARYDILRTSKCVGRTIWRRSTAEAALKPRCTASSCMGSACPRVASTVTLQSSKSVSPSSTGSLLSVHPSQKAAG
jgi:hypothetical protein